MGIVGLQKNSLIDFPGKVSCVLFVSGCNFTCPFCHNPELVRGPAPQELDIESVLTFLDRRRGFLDGVVISGGEPTLWDGLEDLCAEIQGLELAVKLDTNGSRPGVVRRLLDAGRIDYLAMDLKTAPALYRPPLCPPGTWPLVRKSIAAILNGGIDYEFRTTCVRPFVDEAQVRRMVPAVAGARRYVLQTFRPEKVLDGNFFAGAGPGHTREELERLRAIVSPEVSVCLIR